ncbi:MAG: ShlB/FhaC/HecB family hemolysin secretion/activation protein [Cyanothece sp. SIO2G6]|nr:ShlB/FhaC/HecB family hemolysin secretion/activation protein [Cyanothece sp. SIO2G6]
MIHLRQFTVFASIVGLCFSAPTLPLAPSLAQQLPLDNQSPPDNFDPNFLPEPLPPLPIPPPPDTAPILPPPPPATPDSPSAVPSPEPTGPTLAVQSIQVVGSTIFDADDLAPILTPLEGRVVALEELQQAADAITQLYLNEGYLNSRAILVNQEVVEGQVTIQVIEGRIGEIIVEGTERLRDRYIRRRVALGTKVPLRTDQLEDQLRLLRANPLLENVEASLRAGDELGESIVIVRVVEADALFGSFGVDNYSPPSVGSERTKLTLGHRNLTGLADTLSISYNRSTRGGSDVVDINYQAPINPMEGSVQFRTVFERNRVVQEPFDAFEIRGESERYEVTVRQPLVRSPREELALSLGFSYRDGETLAFFADPPEPIGIGADSDGETRTSVFRFGQDYVRRDVDGAWALRSQFNIGTGLFNATVNDDLPDSEFISWLGQAQRVQRIGNNHLLIIQLDTQLTPNALLSSEQFVIGGGQSVRGFRQNARAGDNGIRFSIEDRFTVARDEAGASTLQIIPFLDMGTIWNDPDNDSVERPDQDFLAGIGLGIYWQALPNLDLRLDFGIPLVDLDDRSVNAQDDGIYFNVNYRL